MRIDPFTFVAQILNFLILLALLRRFLYRPVLAAVDRREEEIASRLRAAARQREEAEAEAGRHRELQAGLEAKRTELLRRAEEEAAARREELRREAREEVEQVRESWRESLRRQREDFLGLLRARMSRHLFEGMRKALGELADAELEGRVVEVFVRRLRELTTGEREGLADAVRESGGRVRVRSAFPLPEPRRRAIAEVVEGWGTEEDLELHFEEVPELGVGVELVAGDRRVGWTAASYLRELEAEAVELLEAEAG